MDKNSNPKPALGRRLGDFALGELEAARGHLAREGEARHQGVHQARKAIRRARAVLALGRGVLGDAGRKLDAELAALCRGLSPLRDAQALVEGLDRLAGQAPPDLQAAMPELLMHARERRAERLRRALAADPGMARRQARLAGMARRLDALDWSALKRGDVAKALQRSERRVRKARDRTRRKPGRDEHWHSLRRRLRRLRQQDQLLSGIEPELRPTLSVTAEEAAQLGESQDNALLIRHCGTGSPFPAGLRRVLRAEARARLRGARGNADREP